MERSKLPLSRSKRTNIGLPILRLKWLIQILGSILLRSWVHVAAEQQVFTVCDETGRVSPPLTRNTFALKGTSVCIIRAGTDIGVIEVYKVIVINLLVSGAKELEEVLLLIRLEITQFINILVGARLDLAVHVLFPKDMSLFFVSVLGFGLRRKLLHEFLVILLPLKSLFKYSFLLLHSLHHFH